MRTVSEARGSYLEPGHHHGVRGPLGRSDGSTRRVWERVILPPVSRAPLALSPLTGSEEAPRNSRSIAMFRLRMRARAQRRHQKRSLRTRTVSPVGSIYGNKYIHEHTHIRKFPSRLPLRLQSAHGSSARAQHLHVPLAASSKAAAKKAETGWRLRLRASLGEEITSYQQASACRASFLF